MHQRLARIVVNSVYKRLTIKFERDRVFAEFSGKRLVIQPRGISSKIILSMSLSPSVTDE